jgi:hypothetical protein
MVSRNCLDTKEDAQLIELEKKYVVDDKRNRIGVFLNISDYQTLLGALEELESIRAFDVAKSSADEAIPFEQAVEEIEKNRR